MFRSGLVPLLFCTMSARALAQNDGPQNTLTPGEQADGWKLLFDGTKTLGLQGLQKRDFLAEGWEIKDGELVLPKSVHQSGKMTGGDLVTSAQYFDFEFKFDFKLSASALTGVLYFARAGLNQKPIGHEYQIIDDVHHPDGLKGGPIRRTAALYDVLPPSDNKELHPPEEWNSGAILVRGNHVEHWLNGQKVLQYECGSLALKKAVAASGAQVGASFGTKIKSSLAILDKGEEVAFRNLKIRDLSAKPAPPPVVAPPIAMPAPPPAKVPWTPPPLPPPPILNPQ